MADSSFDLEIQLTPDWLKEDRSLKEYAKYEGPFEEREQSGALHRHRRGEKRVPRRGRGDRQPQGRSRRDRPLRHEHPPVQPAAVEVEFIPDPQTVAGMTEQIRLVARAFPLFGMARMFLMRPERHRVRITTREKTGPLHQAGAEGAVSLNRADIERVVFNATKDQYFVEETVKREPIKGKFTNVARCRLNGAILGPTNYHTYQAGLRRLFEEKFSRRMAFADFQREIEIVRDPEVVEKWKEDQCTVTVLKLRENPEVVFESESEAESHFKKHFLQNELRTENTVEISGDVSRSLPDRSLVAAIRAEWEKERGFPAKIVGHLRKTFLDAGLHLFKHRKRIQYVSSVRPVPFSSEGGGAVSPGIASILEKIGAQPGCSRKQLAENLLASDADEAARSALASDLHWLIHAGHVIEFHDGKLDLPFVRQKPVSEHRGADTQRAPENAEESESVKSGAEVGVAPPGENFQAQQPEQ